MDYYSPLHLIMPNMANLASVDLRTSDSFITTPGAACDFVASYP